MPLRRRSRLERLQRKGDVAGLIRLLHDHDWVEGTDGRLHDLAAPTRGAAATALGEFDDERARNALVDALGDTDTRVRMALVEVVAAHPHPELSAALAIALARWEEPVELRERAMDVLAARDDPWLAVFHWEALLDEPARPGVGSAEQRALGRLAAVSDFDSVVATRSGRLIERLTVTDEHERRRLIAILTGLGTPVVEPLINALDDPSRRSAAATALGGIRDERAIGPLTDLLEDEDPALRVIAAIALGRVRHPATAEALIRASLDDRIEVRDAAQAALDQIGAAGILAGLAAVIGPMAQRLERLEQSANGHAVAPVEAPESGGSLPFLRRFLERGA